MKAESKDWIPASSVFVNFSSLVGSTTIPKSVQRMTRDEIDMFVARQGDKTRSN